MKTDRSLALRVLAVIVAAAACFVAWGVSPYPELEQRADRYFDHQEWAQAAATYGLMLDVKPQDAPLYGRAIVASAMLPDTAATAALLAQALDNHVPFDSIFSHVRRSSFAIGQGNLYPQFLITAKSHYPWMQRAVDSYLLQYYTFRRDGAKMVNLSRAMLQGAPDNILFLSTLARGQMTDGNFDQSIQAWNNILALDPANLQALLWLGNWYSNFDSPTSRHQALDYLTRAFAVAPSPYLEAKIKALY